MFDLIFFMFMLYMFMKVFRGYANYSKNDTYSHQTFRNVSVTMDSIRNSDLGLFVALSAKVAKADGVVDKLEAQLVGMMFDDISSVYPEPRKAKEILKKIFNSEKNTTNDTEAIAHRLGRAIRGDAQKQQQFMGFFIQLAFADGEVSKEEDEVLQTIANAFNFDPRAYHAIFNQYESMMKQVHPQASIADAYKLLGVSERDDISVIKKAYRKKIREYHPDIIKSQNKSEAYMEEATRKTQEINQAYEMIKKAKK